MMPSSHLFSRRLLLLAALIVVVATASPVAGTAVATDSAPVTDASGADWQRLVDAGAAGPDATMLVPANATSGAVVDQRTVHDVVVAGNGDLDGDGVDNWHEHARGMDLARGDSDGDGLADGAELRSGTDPTSSDTDGDEVGDAVEANGPTDPARADTDGDGLADGAELGGVTEPTDPDTDSDGLDDGDERTHGTDSTDPDTDDDGLTDGAEASSVGSNPARADTDGDFLGDRTEWVWGSNPVTPWSPATLLGVTAGFAVGLAVALVGVTRRERAFTGIHCLPLAGLFERPGPAPAAVPEPDGTDEAIEESDLLPDETRVEQLLRSREGGMKQSAIVEATEWSKSKVSRLLSAMADEGDIVKVRLGRENLVFLKGREPDILRQPGVA